MDDISFRYTLTNDRESVEYEFAGVKLTFSFAPFADVTVDFKSGVEVIDALYSFPRRDVIANQGDEIG